MRGEWMWTNAEQIARAVAEVVGQTSRMTSWSTTPGSLVARCPSSNWILPIGVALST